jgi:penicillin-binding protein 1A
MQAIAGEALRRQLEGYDRARGYRGPVARIEDLDPADEAGWRAQLAAVEAPRDIPGWRLAVVLLVGERSAQIGIEGIEGAEPIYIPFSDVRDWARRLDGTRAGSAPRRPSDVWSVGDVVHVMPVMAEDGSTIERWSLRQVPAVQGAFMAMDVETGRVLALQGGFSHGASVFNRATQAMRQPGSSFKPFVYAAALDRGYTPATIILDAPVTVDTGAGMWRPQNSSGRYYGPAPMRIGLEMSRNLMTIRLAQEIGMETVADYAKRFGVYDAMPPLLSYALGAGETTLQQMVAAYAMFANGGRQIAPTLVDRVQDRHGRTIWRHDAQDCLTCGAADMALLPDPSMTGAQIMDPITAYQITSMLHGVTLRGTAVRPFADVPVPVAGKTGTTNDARDVWFVGFSPRIAAGCYIGFDEPTPLGASAFGGTLCAPMVAEFYRKVYADRPGGTFREPEGIVRVAVNRWNGQPGGGADSIQEVFRVGQDPESTGPVIGSEIDSFFFGGAISALDAGPEVQGAGPQGGGATRPPRASDGFGAPGGLY